MRLDDVESINQSTVDGVAYVKLDDPESPPVDHGIAQTNNPHRFAQVPRERAFSGALKDANQFLSILANDRPHLQEDLGDVDANPFGNEDDEEEEYYDEVQLLNESSVLQFKPVLGIEGRMKKRLYDAIRFHHWKIAIVSVWALCNIALFTSALVNYYYVRPTYAELSYGIGFARGFAWTITFNLFIMLLLVNSRITTKIHSLLPWHGLAKLTRKSHVCHKYLAYVIMVSSIGHTFAHIYNLKQFASASWTQINRTLGPERADEFFGGNLTNVTAGVSMGQTTRMWFYLFFTSTPTLTGLIMIVAFIVVFCSTRVKFRRKKFHIFFFLHIFCYFVIIVCLFVHGTARWLNEFPFVGIVLSPVVLLYLIDRVIVLFRRQFPLVIDELKESGGVVHLTLMFRSNALFSFGLHTGQYCKICVPEISLVEYHPFSIMSCEGDDRLELGIKNIGDWTNKLCEMVKNNESPTFYYDGSFGANAQFFLKYDHFMMVSTGIGVTPFVAVLRAFARQRTPNFASKNLVVYFIWMGAETPETYPFMIQAVKELQLFCLDHPNLLFVPKLFFTRMKKPPPDPTLGLGENVVYYGSRPVMQDIFVEIVQQYDQFQLKFGVFVCGPKVLMNTLYETCYLFNEQTNTQFTLYREGF